MVSKIYLGVLILVSFFIPNTVSAQTTPTSSQTAVITSAPIPVKSMPNIGQKQVIQQARKETKEEFILKLSALKDEKKKTITDKINTRLTTTNANLNERMTKALDKLTTFLLKATSKTAALKTAGKDTAALDALIVKAHTALDNARTVLAAQAAKSYTFNVTNDTTVKSEIGVTTTQFKKDMTATHKEIVNARIAVMNVFAEVMRITRNEVKTSTNSGIIQ